ncbi:MAG TPA: hypothetical protein P5248_01640, partial [Bacteroidales bacterium]|nr:hypothetical protein [Bacteroidales bacterium]
MTRSATMNGLFLAMMLGLLGLVQAQTTQITTEDMQRITTFLASDKLEGRKPGTRGDLEAAEYIRDYFQRSGLKLMGEKGFQEFEVVTGAEAGGSNRLMINNQQLELGSDYVALSFSRSTLAEGELIFAGYGFVFENDSMSVNNYAEQEVSGRWVLILRGEPQPDNARSPYVEYAGERHKVLIAEDLGAAGVIFVNGPQFDADDKLPDMYFDKSAALARIPVVQVKRAVLSRIFEDGLDLSMAENQLNDGKWRSDRQVLGQVIGETDVRQKVERTRNVVAMVEGTDENLRNEYVIMGAHYDHLGLGGPG